MIDKIIQGYESYVAFLNGLDDKVTLDIATEADTNTADATTKTSPTKNEAELTKDVGGKTDTVNQDKSEVTSSAEKGKKFGEMMNDLIMSIQNSIKDFVSRHTNMFQLLMTTDKGFIKDYTFAKGNYQPSTGQEVLIFQYNSSKLETIRKLFNLLITGATNAFSNTRIGAAMPADSIFEASDNSFDSVILSNLKAPKQIKTMKEYFELLKEDFRGKKVKLVVRPGDIPKYEKAALSSVKGLRAVLNGDKSAAYSLVAKVTTNLKLVKNNHGLTDETRERAKKYAKRLVRLEHAYNSFLDLYFTLKFEEVLSAREVLKRMYKI